MNIHPTMEKFGYPSTLIHEYEHWVVCLRPAQPTLGSLVLICKEDKQAYSDISASAFTELKSVISDIETALSSFTKYEKINYLMLMMVDKEVHYHVIPRYEGARIFEGISYADAGWPAVPNLGEAHKLSESERDKLIAELKNKWNSA